MDKDKIIADQLKEILELKMKLQISEGEGKIFFFVSLMIFVS